MGYAAAEGGDGFCFVGEGGDGLDQAREFEDFPDVAGGVQDFQAAALAFESDEGAHQRANAGAINLRDAGKIDEDLGGASFGELAQFRAMASLLEPMIMRPCKSRMVTLPDFSLSDLQAHESLLAARECAARLMSAWRQDYLKQ